MVNSFTKNQNSLSIKYKKLGKSIEKGMERMMKWKCAQKGKV